MSIINLASVAAIETVLGVPVHPLRFRANLYVEGWPAWHEFALLDREIAIGDARLKVTKRIVRCAATNVDPDTGIRDLAIPSTLDADLRSRGLRRLCAGDRGGEIAGDTITPNCGSLRAGDRRRGEIGCRADDSQSVNASGRATCSSGLRSAATPQRHITAAAATISAAPSR